MGGLREVLVFTKMINHWVLLEITASRIVMCEKTTRHDTYEQTPNGGQILFKTFPIQQAE